MTKTLEKAYEWFTYPLFKIGSQAFSFSFAANLIFSLLIVILITRLTKALCKTWLLGKFRFDVGNQEAISTLITYCVGTLSLIIVLQSSGLNLDSLAVVAGGLGIGVGFGLQSITRDFISGLILLLRRSIKVNDFLEFGGRQEFKYLQGTVKKIALLSTIIQTRDGASLIIPNSYLVIYPVLNWSYGSYINRICLLIRVRQNSDLVLFTETVLQTANRESSVLSSFPPKLVFKKFSEKYLEFELQVWIKQIQDEDAIRTNLNYAIEYHLRQQGIEIAFPTYELWLREQELTKFEQNINNDQNAIALDSSLLTQLQTSQAKPLSVRDLLKKVTYFENFTELELRHLIEIGNRKRLGKEEILFKEGDPGDAFYIVLSGSVEVFVAKLEKHLATLKPGEFFGELSLILGIPRTASVRAIESTILFAINSQGFKQLLQEPSELAEVIVKELGKHQEELAQRQQQLREMGLIDKDEDDANLIAWVRKRLGRLFG